MRERRAGGGCEHARDDDRRHRRQVHVAGGPGRQAGLPQAGEDETDVPATAIGRPSAAEVATALWILTLWRPRYGIETKPPPAPSRLEIAPIPAPTPKSGSLPGNWRPGRGALTISIRVAANQTKSPNTAAKTRPGNAPAICGPTSEPSTMPGAIAATTGHSTAPLP